MGSTWSVRIATDDERHVAGARTLQTPIETILERVDAEMSTYRPESEISRFNRHRSTAPFPVSPETASVVRKAIDVARATDGAYDITLDPLIDLWGFDRDGGRDTPPSAAEIAKAREHTGYARLGVAGDALRKSDPQVTINLGGIASGFAVDLIAGLLDREGFGDYMIDVTGEVRARGKNVDDQPWRIGVQLPVPDADPRAVLTAISLVDQSVTTSGSYRNFFESGGKRYHHILDPKTGAPVATDLVSVTVLYKDAVTADGYDTPFFILGEERARAILAGIPGMEALFVYADEAGKLRVAKTSGFPALGEPSHECCKALRHRTIVETAR
jgi:thiamine biosynthesis lipoprotein